MACWTNRNFVESPNQPMMAENAITDANGYERPNALRHPPATDMAGQANAKLR
jgi:hypothetical protein